MSDRRKKVLLIIPNLGSGGAQRVFHQHRTLLTKDFDVVACAFNFDDAFDHEKESGIISLDVPGGSNPISKVLRFFERVRRLKQLKKKHGIDVSISHLEGADYVNVLSKGKDKVMLWVHGTKFHDQNIAGLTGWLRKSVLMPKLYARADKIVCVSSGINHELLIALQLDAKKICTVHNGVNIAEIQDKVNWAIEEQWDDVFTTNDPFIVTHCRLAAQKNLSALIEIIAKLKDDGTRLLIIGDGEEREQLLALCHKYKLKTYDAWSGMKLERNYTVYFAGRYDNPFSMMGFCTLYVMTSKWEGFPLSLCEALACGRAVIASDCFTGPREILKSVDGDAGCLMPVPEDAISIGLWVDKIKEVLKDSEGRLSLSQRATKRANDFSEEVFYSSSVEQIRSVTE